MWEPSVSEKNTSCPSLHEATAGLPTPIAANRLSAGAGHAGAFQTLARLLAPWTGMDAALTVTTELFRHFGYVNTVLVASKPALMRLPSMTEPLADFVRQLASFIVQREAEVFLVGACLEDWHKVTHFLRTLNGWQERECLVALFGDTRGRYLGHEIHATGSLDECQLFRRELLRSALEHNASGLILCHNHPSGNCNPSNSDLTLTEGLLKACNAVGLRFWDHIIVGPNGSFSMNRQKVVRFH